MNDSAPAIKRRSEVRTEHANEETNERWIKGKEANWNRVRPTCIAAPESVAG
jgi:hypothetical protein